VFHAGQAAFRYPSASRSSSEFVRTPPAPGGRRKKARSRATEFYPVEKIAPGIIVRKSVSQPVLTGIMAIDSMIPIGRGQRELIIGDRGTGKTTIAIDTIINQARINRIGLASNDPAFRPLYSIYVAVGQKNSNIARTIASLEAAGALEYTIIVAAPAADNPANQYVAPYAGAAMASGSWKTAWMR